MTSVDTSALRKAALAVISQAGASGARAAEILANPIVRVHLGQLPVKRHNFGAAKSLSDSNIRYVDGALQALRRDGAIRSVKPGGWVLAAKRGAR